ncbi:MAG TPA: hypothetical protein VMZ53_07445 [Kofleriaceae bacterium]|nr:hypothetical protein [Kofleriaceae bacterium]
MGRHVIGLAAFVLAGCGFEHGELSTSSMIDAPMIDAPDAEIDSPAITCTPGFVDLCNATPGPALAIAGADTINTDNDPRCVTVAQAAGSAVCLVYASSVMIGSSASLTATGSRPLAIASASTLAIDGIVDVSSQRVTAQIGPAADYSACAVMTPAEDDAGGAGGGAGASFANVGGDGGTGDTDMGTSADGSAVGGRPGGAATVTFLRGGCRGEAGADNPTSGAQGGDGGHGGGALYLFAHDQVAISGIVRATGAGGVGGTIMPTGSGGGGGGGGSGGLVVIESAAIAISGQISANGGGGGEGAFVGGNGGGPLDGRGGDDGVVGTTAAAGGHNTGYVGTGTGGAGAAGTTTAVNGGNSVAGGGGGGGAAGRVKLIGSSTISGIVSPPAS